MNYVKSTLLRIAAIAIVATVSVSTLSAKAPSFKHVVLIASDGLSAETIEKNPGMFPQIEALMKRGSYTLHARSVLPSSSAINWATLLMGAPSEMHGFTDWGSKTPEVKPAYVTQYGMFPGIFGAVRDHKPTAKTGVFYAWDGIGYLFEKKAVDKDFYGKKSDEVVARKAIEFIAAEKPTLTFVCFDNPDGAGHKEGWMSPGYLKMCEKIDTLVGDIVRCVDENLDPKTTAIIFTADHGGVAGTTGHGGKTMGEMEVPYIIVGKGIPANRPINRIVMRYDNAPTIADMLRVPKPEQWRGKSLFE